MYVESLGARKRGQIPKPVHTIRIQKKVNRICHVCLYRNITIRSW